MRAHVSPDIESRIDLHAHSTYSDGTCGIDGLLAEARAARLDVLGLTDHDTTSGWAEAAAAVARHGVAVVPGIEVSTEHGRTSVHVLALLPDPSDGTDLAREMARARESRRTRARAMVERLAADFPLTWGDVAEQTAGEATTVGRPHIADALVAAGVVPDRGTAFASMLSPSSPYYVRHYAPAPAVAVAAIRAAGGVPVAAHPASGARGHQAPDSLLEEMAAAGLVAIEVDHREHTDAERRRLRDLARSLGLLVTGGSDYHGSGKPNRLGENLTSPDVLDAMISLSTSGTEVLRP
ncbi:PHP domain-containing protein [Brachybacterium huguangmaarense]